MDGHKWGGFLAPKNPQDWKVRNFHVSLSDSFDPGYGIFLAGIRQKKAKPIALIDGQFYWIPTHKKSPKLEGLKLSHIII